MTDRRGDQGFSVEPQRIGDGPVEPRRRRARRIGLVLVVVASAAVFGIGWLGPRLSGRPAFDISFFATPAPSRTPSPAPAVTPNGILPIPATPLPAITRPEGPGATGRVAFLTSTFSTADVATGTVVTGPQVQAGQDAVFPSANGGWTCICFGFGAGPSGQAVRARIVGIGPTGVQTDAADVATLGPGVVNPDAASAVTVDVDAWADGRRALLATGTQTDEARWEVAVAPVDVAGRRLRPGVLLGTATAPPAPVSSAPGASVEPVNPAEAVTFLDGPHVRVAPDGRVAFVWATAQRTTPDSPPQPATFAWRVALGPDGSVGAIADVPALRDRPLYCDAMGFAAADRLAWLCPDITDPTSDFGGRWQFGSVDLDGRPAGTTDVDLSTDGYVGAPLLDRANGMAYAWDATGLTMIRIDVRTMAVTRTTFDRNAESADGVGVGGGSARADWHGADSAVRQMGFGQLAGDPDGVRIYAIGYDTEAARENNGPATLGALVIDRATLALVGRWAPDAAYQSAASLPGGLVAFGGIPGTGPDGVAAPWEASLTVYDAATGRIVVRFGRLGIDSAPLILSR